MFKGLETKAKEFSQAARPEKGYLEPRRVAVHGSNGEHTIVSFDAADLLRRKLQQDGAVRRELESASDRFKSGELYQKEAAELTCLADGTALRWHPCLMKKATEEEAFDFRIPLVFNCDDIEVRPQ